MENPRYLGDGVYAKYDGYQIELMANDHMNPTDRIYLDSSTLTSFLKFIDEIKENNL